MMARETKRIRCCRNEEWKAAEARVTEWIRRFCWLTCACAGVCVCVFLHRGSQKLHRSGRDGDAGALYLPQLLLGRLGNALTNKLTRYSNFSAQTENLSPSCLPSLPPNSPADADDASWAERIFGSDAQELPRIDPLTASPSGIGPRASPRQRNHKRLRLCSLTPPPAGSKSLGSEVVTFAKWIFSFSFRPPGGFAAKLKSGTVVERNANGGDKEEIQ